MSDYDNTDRGVLFKNDRKESGNQPDYTGKIEPCCSKCGHQEERRLAAWIKDSRSGTKFMSISISSMEQNSRAVQDAAQHANDSHGPDEDIPF